MSFKKYRGPVETVDQAMMAHAVLVITCQDCGHYTRRWAWRIYEKAKDRVVGMPLRKPVPGFRCSRCRRGVDVIMTIG